MVCYVIVLVFRSHCIVSVWLQSHFLSDGYLFLFHTLFSKCYVKLERLVKQEKKKWNGRKKGECHTDTFLFTTNLFILTEAEQQEQINKATGEAAALLAVAEARAKGLRMVADSLTSQVCTAKSLMLWILSHINFSYFHVIF